MASMRTTVSIQKSLFDQVDAIAHDMELSSDFVLERAVGEFVQRYNYNMELLNKINTAYTDLPDQEEQLLLKKMKTRHRNLVEGQW